MLNWGEEKDYPGPAGLGKIREAELLAAARVLHLREVIFLDYVDGDLDQANPTEVIGQLAAQVRHVHAQVRLCVTKDPSLPHRREQEAVRQEKVSLLLSLSKDLLLNTMQKER